MIVRVVLVSFLFLRRDQCYTSQHNRKGFGRSSLLQLPAKNDNLDGDTASERDSNSALSSTPTIMDKQDEPDEATLEEQMNSLLDREFFRPEKVPPNSPLRWFADLLENDYATAEALYASLFITFMVIVSQELLRMQLYGDQYVPFQKVGNGANLF